MCAAIIATWRMALDGVENAMSQLHEGASISDAVQLAVMNVEDNPLFHSVGNGGLPNENGKVELDAAWMDGNTLNYGAVMAVEGLKNPISVARKLSGKQRNNVLAGEGALQYAINNQFAMRNNLSSLSLKKWKEQLVIETNHETQEAYDGHDTVCILGAKNGEVIAGLSTSGLFMKHAGRVGDTPIIGSGCYADSDIGSAAATGVGEDIMKGCLSYEIVRLMEHMSPQQACTAALAQHQKRLQRSKNIIGSMSVIALNKEGEWGAATTKNEFSFVVGQDEGSTEVWISSCEEGKVSNTRASDEWLKKYADALKHGSGN